MNQKKGTEGEETIFMTKFISLDLLIYEYSD